MPLNLQPGDDVGHYRILEPLGKGGMGEVFVAEDTKLHRRVALKVLPQIFAADADARQRRFEREAQAVAALNHPGIVTIHSVEEHDGRLLLTMELVDGKPLNESIPRGGLPLDRLLRIGIEVADAMAAAQQRGITHRDVKPANIVLTSSGRAKVLDFGLAKIHEAEMTGPGDDLTRMSTRSDLTGEGKIIGTVAYMSPEQAEGKSVDPRSDIFSLGVVLHEMATGERPFRGDTNVSIISAILKDTPAPVTDTHPDLPADLARIIRRCLAKDPERRYQTAADLRNELEELKQDTASGPVTIVRPVKRRRSRLMIAVIGAAVVAALAIAGWMLYRQRAAPASSAASSFTIDRLARLTSTGSASMAAISPDGRYVVHVKREPDGVGLWTRQTATTSDVRIVPPADVRFDGLVFSPDANYIYYSTYVGVGGIATLYRVPVLGGAPTRVLEDIDSPVTFSADAKQMAFLRGSVLAGTTELMVAEVGGANARALARAPAGDKFQAEQPSWSPDGATILVTASSTRPGVPAAIYAVDARTGATRVVGQPWGFVRDVQWLPDGRSFLATGADMSGMSTPQIWQVDFPSGTRSRVTNDLNAYIGTSLSADGHSLATIQVEATANIYVAEGPAKEPLRLTHGSGTADGNNGLAWLPDGRLVYTSSASGLPQLWICDADGNNAHQVTSTAGPALSPSASLADQWIYFTSIGKGGTDLFRIAPDGAGLQQITTDGDARGGVLSPDGKTLYYTAIRSGSPRLMKISAEGGKAESMGDAYFQVRTISFDGARLLGASWSDPLKRNVNAIMVLAGRALQVLPDLPAAALFMPDGGFAFVRRAQGKSTVMIEPAAGGTPRPATPPDEQNIALAGAVSRDGRIAFVRGTSTADVVLVKAK